MPRAWLPIVRSARAKRRSTLKAYSLLKRGVSIRLIVDNGAAYRAQTLQGICARLGIHLIHCRPYAPEGKGKLERWHRTCRDQFLSELDERLMTSLDDLNARLWAWLEQVSTAARMPVSTG